MYLFQSCHACISSALKGGKGAELILKDLKTQAVQLKNRSYGSFRAELKEVTGWWTQNRIPHFITSKQQTPVFSTLLKHGHSCGYSRPVQQQNPRNLYWMQPHNIFHWVTQHYYFHSADADLRHSKNRNMGLEGFNSFFFPVNGNWRQPAFSLRATHTKLHTGSPEKSCRIQMPQGYPSCLSESTSSHKNMGVFFWTSFKEIYLLLKHSHCFSRLFWEKKQQWESMDHKVTLQEAGCQQLVL